MRALRLLRIEHFEYRARGEARDWRDVDKRSACTHLYFERQNSALQELVDK